jgi:Ca2+-binding EF-hand superfamily protein
MAEAYSNNDLGNAIDLVFQKYDKDKSGSLDTAEITALITDVYAKLGKKVTEEDTKKFITVVDNNGDGKISKAELLQIFKKILSKK